MTELALLAIVGAAILLSAVESDAAGERRPLELGQVKLSGWLGERFDRAVKAFDNLRSAIWWDCAGQWGHNLTGHWLRNMSLVSQVTGEADPALHELAEQLLKMQSEGKLESDYGKLKIALWCDSEVLYAFLSYYETTHDRRALDAAGKIGRHMLANRHLASHYYDLMAIPHLLSLSRATGDKSFRDFAIELAERDKLLILGMKEGVHGAAVSMILDAFLDIYGATGELRYLDWAVKGWQATRDRMFVTGGIGEVLNFTTPASESDLHDETCQASWWMIFNLHLWRATGDAKYADMAERVLLNHFAARQLHRGEGGGFCALGDIDQGFRGDHNYFCCDGEGLLGFLKLLGCIFMQEPGKPAVSVNFLLDSEARFTLAEKQEVTVRQKTPYPERGVTKLTIGSHQPARFALSVRIPCGSRATETLVNGTPAKHKSAGSRVTIDREWKDGDTLTVIFPIPMTVEADNTGKGPRTGSVEVNGRDQQAKRVAVLYGSIVSAVFRTGHGNDLSWVWTGDYPEVLDTGGSVVDAYPGSKPDLLELDGKSWSTGVVPGLTTASCDRSVPSIGWEAGLNDAVRTKHELRVLPGLPVIIQDREEVTGWDGKGRLLCSGLRFATTKTATSSYGTISWPYPFPCVTTKPDLSNTRNLVKQAGTFGLYEQLVDGAALAKTGVVELNNGYFAAISLYDPEPVNQLICRRDENWVGVYLEPAASKSIVLSRWLVFPLAEKPMSQTTAKMIAERASHVKASVEGDRLVLTGPVLHGAPILIPKSTGLKPGSVITSTAIASYVWDYDADHLMIYADAPEEYSVVE